MPADGRRSERLVDHGRRRAAPVAVGPWPGYHRQVRCLVVVLATTTTVACGSLLSLGEAPPSDAGADAQAGTDASGAVDVAVADVVDAAGDAGDGAPDAPPQYEAGNPCGSGDSLCNTNMCCCTAGATGACTPAQIVACTASGFAGRCVGY
jgi:hypothetical protein